jgi:DNA-binding transcriptional regulator LsrR (DeoR family)
MERENLAGRNGLIWRDYCAGRTQEWLAAEYGLSQPRVSGIIREVRDNLVQETREQEIQRSLDMLAELRAGALEVYRMAPAPVFVGKDGDVARDPENDDAIVRDHTGRLRALETAVKVDERISRLLGLDAATKMDLAVSSNEVSAAETLAADAAKRVAGD